MFMQLPVGTVANRQPPQQQQSSSIRIICTKAPFHEGSEVLLGVGGLPVATTSFRSPIERFIRYPRRMAPEVGPNIPRHWYDGGDGWVPKYFYDSVPYEPGIDRCQVILEDGQRCDHEISDA